jgi:hypothetical protein
LSRISSWASARLLAIATSSPRLESYKGSSGHAASTRELSAVSHGNPTNSFSYRVLCEPLYGGHVGTMLFQEPGQRGKTGQTNLQGLKVTAYPPVLL